MKVTYSKVTKVVLILGIVISMAIIQIYIWDNSNVKYIGNLKEFNLVSNGKHDVIGEIDKIEEEEKYITIEGWGVNTKKIDYFNYVIGEGKGIYINNTVILVDEDEKAFAINTISVNREDISKMINDGVDYTKCGFKGKLKKSKLPKGIYKLGILVEGIDGEKQIIISDKEIRK